jgi:hypothetical protein
MTITLSNHTQPSRRTEINVASTAAVAEPAAGRIAFERLAAQLELVTRTTAVSSLSAGLQLLVDEAQRFSGCQSAALGLVGADRQCRLRAVSRTPKLDAGSETCRRLEAVLQEASLQGEMCCLEGPENATHLGAHRELAAATHVDWMVSIPLPNAQGKIRAVWTLVGRPTRLTPNELRAWLAACSQAVGGQVELLDRAFESPWFRFFRAAGQFCRQRQLWISLAVVVGLCLALVRLPYEVGTTAVLQPVVRRYVAAPFQGQLERCLVKPGDLVEQGQCLARMEGRDLRSELASLIAEEEQAAKEYDVNLATGKRAAAQVAGLEVDRLKQRRQLLERRIEQIEISCPISGVVISGDLERSESAPVNLGQPLLEIAPLDALLCEVEIPDSEMAHIEVGQSLRIMLDTFPGRVFQGKLERVHPRSEIREQRNVFIGQVSLDNASGELRPGMKGKVRVITDWQNLGWIVLHKPWNWLSSCWDW